MASPPRASRRPGWPRELGAAGSGDVPPKSWKATGTEEPGAWNLKQDSCCSSPGDVAGNGEDPASFKVVALQSRFGLMDAVQSNCTV